MTSTIDGLNQSVRNVPDSSRMMKLYSAISPSMNDQWSGKTLLRFFFEPLVEPRRSSTKRGGAAPPALFDHAHPRSQKLGPTGSAKS